MTPIDYIDFGHIVLQLAEEAAELSQAASKYARARMGVNPTPVDKDAAWDHLIEEAGDVLACFSAMFTEEEFGTVYSASQEKYARWIKRLEEHHAK